FRWLWRRIPLRYLRPPAMRQYQLGTPRWGLLRYAGYRLHRSRRSGSVRYRAHPVALPAAGQWHALASIIRVPHAAHGIARAWTQSVVVPVQAVQSSNTFRVVCERLFLGWVFPVCFSNGVGLDVSAGA